MSTQATDLVVRRSVTVERTVEEAFRVFTERIGSWWPLDSHSIGGDRAETAIMEGRVGGRLYERMKDGSEASWGTIDVWEPPSRLVISWKVNPRAPAPTEVEVRFVPNGTGTRVELEHRGWERYGDEAAAASTNYRSGWKVVLGRYADAAGGGMVS